MLFESRKRKGQSTIEYLLLLSAVIVVVFLFARKDGIFSKALNASINTAINSMDGFSNDIFK